MDVVTQRGQKITYQRAGSGDALVLLHGGFGFDSAGMLTECAPKDMVEHTLALMSDILPEASLTMLRAVAEADLRDILPTSMCQPWYCTATTTPGRRSRSDKSCANGSPDRDSSCSRASGT